MGLFWDGKEAYQRLLASYDFETDNVFYMEAESRYCAIDFDDAMYHWFMMDVTSALSELIEQDDQDAKHKIYGLLRGKDL